jgi:transposase
MTRKAYKTDITEAQWQILEPLIPPAKAGGHPRTVNMREVTGRKSVGIILRVLATILQQFAGR